MIRSKLQHSGLEHADRMERSRVNELLEKSCLWTICRGSEQSCRREYRDMRVSLRHIAGIAGFSLVGSGSGGHFCSKWIRSES